MFDPRFLVAPEPAALPVWVEPSAKLLAEWAEWDAQVEALCGEPVEGADLGALAAAGLSDFELVEQVAALERDISWAKARQLAVVHALAGRASMNPFWPVTVGQPNIAAEEVAAVLGTSRVVGRELVEAARLFAGVLWPTADALRSGEIDWTKARIVIAALRHAAGPVAIGVQHRVLPGAGRRTPTQLRTDLQRALIAVDPADAEQRHVRAVDERRVCHPKVLPDGMAGIWLVLPAPAAAAIDAALDRRARAAKAAGDPRTVDQLRADTFGATLTGDHPNRFAHPTDASPTGATPAVALPSGALPGGALPGAAFGFRPSPDALAGGSCSGAGLGRALGARAQISVTVALTTLLGLDEAPGDLAGYGPITAQTARRLAATGTWRRLVTDPVTGTVLDVGRTRYHPPADLADIVRARDQQCLSPICGAAAKGCDLDHREPFHADGTGGATSAENLGPLCERDHLIKTHGGWHLDKNDDTNTFTWTTPTGHTYDYRSQPPPGHEPEWDPPPF